MNRFLKSALFGLAAFIVLTLVMKGVTTLFDFKIHPLAVICFESAYGILSIFLAAKSYDDWRS